MGSPPPGYPPDYPPPPPPPSSPPPSSPPPQSPPSPPAAPAVPSWAPNAPAYQQYPYGQAAPPPAAPRQSSRQLWTIMAVIAGVALLLVIGGTYGAAGYFSASSRLGSADHAIDTTLAHRSAFDNAPSTLELDAPDAKTLQSDAAKFLQAWKQQAATIESDDQALVSAGSGLRQEQWLTIIRRGNLDSASARVAHARKALDTARTIAGERVKEGQFEQALAAATVDFDAVIADFQSNDFVAAVTAANTMQTDANHTLGLTSDTQFPPEVHDFVAAIQALAKDFVSYLSAVAKGDTNGAKTLIAKANTDLNSLQAFDVTSIGEKVDAYYQPLIDTYHSELSKAG